MIDNNIFSCDPLPSNNGYTWTIVSRLGDMFCEAEKLFGSRDKEYTILGIEFANIEQPQIWYPGNCNHVIIQVTKDCSNNMEKAIFQVAHEAIHCLCPNPKKKATVLEEGLATYFSMYYTHTHKIYYNIDNPQYQIAYDLCSKLLNYDFELVKKARIIEPDISFINKEILLSICSNIDHTLIDELTKFFERNQ
mgnify:CR=1 FL=1